MARANERMMLLRGPDNKNILEIAQMFGVPLDKDWEPTHGFWDKSVMYICANLIPELCKTDLGVYSLDANWNLVEYFLTEFHKREILNPENGHKLDAIMINGDHNGHGTVYHDWQ